MALDLESAVFALRQDQWSDFKHLISISNVQNPSCNLLCQWSFFSIYLLDQSSIVCANQIGPYLTG